MDCFNGAALVRARRASLLRIRLSFRHRFNGAALVRARRDAEAEAKKKAEAELQRSRARESAEGPSWYPIDTKSRAEGFARGLRRS